MKRIVGPLGILLVVTFAWAVYALDPPHDSTNSFDCSTCHTPHKAEGGAITKVAGNANLCQSCHKSGGLANAKPFAETDQAFPAMGLPAGMSGSGTSHRWDSGPAGHVKADATNSSTGTVQSGGAFTGRYAKTYTITITAAGDAGTAIFSWTDTRGGGGSGLTTGSGVVLNEGVNATFTDGAGSPNSFLVNDRWKIYVRTDINTPTTSAMVLRISDGKIMCSTCHNQHSQEKEPFDPSAPTPYAGSGTGQGRHYQRLDNSLNEMCRDCHSARDVTVSSNGSHPVGVTIPGTGLFKSPTTAKLDKTTGTVQCMSCHQPHYAPTSDGSLTRLADITALCTDCHTLADTANGSHFNTSTGVLWPGPQYGSTFPAITDTSKRGACINCHQPHGWPDSGSPTQDYAKLLVDQGTGNLCFTCHDSDGPSSKNVYASFNPSPAYSTVGVNNTAIINQKHDAAAVGCSNCHNPHKVTSSQRVMNPDNLSQAWTQTYNKANTYGGATYWSSSSNFDPTNPAGATGGANIGEVAPGVQTGDDKATSGGSYSTSDNLVYTVTVSTGGAPNTAQISVTSNTGADSSGPTTVTAFGTPVAVGTRGVTITFSPFTAATIGAAACVAAAGCDDDTATSGGGPYTGGDDGLYNLLVTTAGLAGVAQLTCTSGIPGDACNPSTTYTWPGNGTPITIGSYGVQVTINDADTRANRQDLVLGEEWEIPVTRAVNSDGVLNQGDTWTIPVNISCIPNCTEPDFVAFCLTCHDSSQPPGVTMPGTMVNIATAFLGGDQHGNGDGSTGCQSTSKGPLKRPWTDQDGCDPSQNYAAIPCTTCHDQHGSPSIFHLKKSVTVAGIPMTLGGTGVFTAFAGQTQYTLPIDSATGSQEYLHWGAWCTFCHTMANHQAVDESTTCNTAHRHGGNNF